MKSRKIRLSRHPQLGELRIQFGSLDELNGLIDRLTRSATP